MITWDGVLASQRRRAEYARLGFPLRLITSAPGLGSGCGIGTAAGTSTPHRSTGSHHNDKGGATVAYLLNAACFASALIVSIGAIVHHHGAGFVAFDWACVGGCFTLLVLMIGMDVIHRREQRRLDKARLDELKRQMQLKAEALRTYIDGLQR